MLEPNHKWPGSTQEFPKGLFIPPKQETRLYNNNNPPWPKYPWKSPRPNVTTPEPRWKGSTAKISQVLFTLLPQRSNPHSPARDAVVSGCSRRVTKTYTSKEAFISLVNTMQSILNKVHEIWEHNQHLLKAGPDQCTPAFERMPEASQPFRDFCTFFINITSVKLRWTSAAGSCPPGQSTTQTPRAASFSYAVFLSSPHRLQQLFLPLGSRPPFFFQLT